MVHVQAAIPPKAIHACQTQVLGPQLLKMALAPRAGVLREIIASQTAQIQKMSFLKMVLALLVIVHKEITACKIDSAMTMRRKIQHDTTGCGIACAAMLAGVTYAAAKSRAIALGLIEKGGPFYTGSAELQNLLGSFGVVCLRGRRVARWVSVTGPAIVAINHQSGSNTWHWVVYMSSQCGAYVLDPRAAIKASRRVDFNRMRLRSFIPVQAA
jgi:hypothetical protein